MRAIVTPDGWKYHHSTLGQHELYHLHEDPYEMRNLATDGGYRALMRDLAERIRHWQERTGDNP